jgi:transcriptional regulator with XRE-family HTH domain
VPQNLGKQLAVFLRKQRGEQTYAKFSRKVGLPPSTLFRLENAQQSITLDRLELILQRLKVTLSNIFPVR